MNGKQLTLSSGAWLLARYPKREEWHTDEYAMVHGTVTGAVAQIQSLPCIPDIKSPRKDARTPLVSMQDLTGPIKVCTDYADTREHITASPHLKLVDSPDEADFLLVLKQISNFNASSLNQFVAQFPYEGGFVRKDLLPLTVRKCCYKDGEAPFWWLPCFDVSTEFHLLYKEYNHRRESNQDNWWILKPSQGCRGQGHKVVYSSSNTESSLSEIAQHCSPFDNENSSDKVAQLLVQRPLLALGRKFDLRLFVVVRSFCPLEAYVHNVFYARLANKPYNTDELSSSEVAITINAYDADESVASKQERLKFDELRNVLLHEAWGLSAADVDTPRYAERLEWWNKIVSSVQQCLRDLFGGVAPTIGSWPLSRAYYAVDVMLDNGAATCSEVEGESVPVPVPKLVEVNYMGDWHGMEGALRVRDAKHEIDDYEEVVAPDYSDYDYSRWCQDILEALMTPIDIDATVFTRL